MRQIDQERVAGAVAALVVAAAIALAFDPAPKRVSDAWKRLTGPGESQTVRELAPAASHGVSTQALVLAQQTIPRDATVAVVVGNAPPLDVNTGLAAAVFFCDWLLPRRCVTDPKQANWVVTYHEPSEALPVAGREIGLGTDANVVQVKR